MSHGHRSKRIVVFSAGEVRDLSPAGSRDQQRSGAVILYHYSTEYPLLRRTTLEIWHVCVHLRALGAPEALKSVSTESGFTLIMLCWLALANTL